MIYTRRKFIKTLAVSAGVVVTSSLVGCGGSDKKTAVVSLWYLVTLKPTPLYYGPVLMMAQVLILHLYYKWPMMKRLQI